MSCVRVHSSLTGVPCILEITADCATNSLDSLRPKPPPERVTLSFTSVSGMPSVLATSLIAAPGFCVGDQISILPSLKAEVVFWGSSGTCATNGY